jgi:hypothetical protein
MDRPRRPRCPQDDGTPIDPGPYGTPTLWREHGRWYLFYERNDGGIWLAASEDMTVWTNRQDDPVIAMGPEAYDINAVALNQIVKHNDGTMLLSRFGP